MDERRFRRGLITLVIAVVILTSVMYILPEPVRGASPTINYVSPADGATFVDVWRGEGVNLTVNVTDADGDLAQVVLKWNNSGTWATFYDSGALGGVSYHNVTVLNANFTGSWETYEWQICAYDTAWTNTTYSFTTEYVFGDPHPITIDDTKDLKPSIFYKNNTNEYYLYVNVYGLGQNTWDYDGNIYYTTSTNGVDIGTKDINSAVGGKFPSSPFVYNNIPYLYFHTNGNGNLYSLNLLTHSTSSTGVDTGKGTGGYNAFGADVKYYDGEYHLLAGLWYVPGSYGVWELRHYISNNPLSSFSKVNVLTTGYSYDKQAWYMPSLNIFGGKLVATYITGGEDLYWKIYNGTSWTDKGIIEADLGLTSSSTLGHYQCTLLDPINDQLVCIYVNASGWLVYRTLSDIDGTWSDPVVIYKPVSGESIGYPYADFIDRRIVVTFASNIRGNWNIYMVTAPDYTSVTSGINITYNRIQFPDATPNQEHVNSTIFAIKNINDRPILNITWHVGDIGDIQTANNVRVWSNMSGSWQSWLVGADQNTSKIDISAVKGSEWMPGETLYWKIEILNTGNVAETLHTNDNDIWYIVDLGT